MRKYFGTDGIRGLANVHPLTAEFAMKLGMACGRKLLVDWNCGEKPLVLLGKDTRHSGYLLEFALASGFLTVGIDVVRLGVTPTPVVAYLTKHSNAAMGVVISASHNPFPDNGIKFFCKAGMKLPDEEEESIETLVDTIEKQGSFPIGERVGRMFEGKEWNDKYVAEMLDTAGLGLDLKGRRVVMDCSNGAAYLVGPRMFRELGAKLRVINNVPNGKNINENCGSTHLEILAREVIASGADFGVAFDGDADRALFVDETGVVVDGDRVMAAATSWMKSRDLLDPPILVATVMSNMGLFKAMADIGVEVRQTRVGDRYVLEEMLASGAIIGGEQSGHVILPRYNTTGDGIVTAMLIARILAESGGTLSAIASVMKVFPQTHRNIRVRAEMKAGILGDEDIASTVRTAEEILGSTGRILVRPSGTEPLIRVMGEGEDEDLVKRAVSLLADKIFESAGE